MKRNWALIGCIVTLIFWYDWMVLRPYNQKYSVDQKAASTAPTTSSTISGPIQSGGPTPAPVEQRIKITDEQKKSSERVDVNDTRYFSIYSDGSIGDVTFNKYFTRGKETREKVRLAENGFHWRSSDVRVDACLKNLTKGKGWTFSGSVEGVTCSVKYEINKLLIDTSVEITASTAVSGDIYFETDDAVGDGPEFDHRYLAVKKKEEKTDKIRGKKLYEGTTRSSGPYDWISWGDKYFSAIVIPKGRFNPDVFHEAGAREKSVHWGIAYPLRWSPELTKVSYNFDTYFALKDLKELRSVRDDLGETIDFGFFGMIAKFMLWALEALYSKVHNYGIAIIILSLAIRLLLWPVNKKMFESGQKMKEIQPQMEAIKKRYEGKTDQLLMMNQEIRELYKKSGVNPLGSCLPVFLQIPIFFGLNTALSNSVDLYQAPFFGWIHDLSYKDPLYILPVIWTISLIVSVELTPQPQSQPGMPNMKWVSRAMFVVFGFVSKDFPSGLNLYFLVSNLAGMTQQIYFRRKGVKDFVPVATGGP